MPHSRGSGRERKEQLAVAAAAEHAEASEANGDQHRANHHRRAVVHDPVARRDAVDCGRRAELQRTQDAGAAGRQLHFELEDVALRARELGRQVKVRLRAPRTQAHGPRPIEESRVHRLPVPAGDEQEVGSGDEDRLAFCCRRRTELDAVQHADRAAALARTAEGVWQTYLLGDCSCSVKRAVSMRVTVAATAPDVATNRAMPAATLATQHPANRVIARRGGTGFSRSSLRASCCRTSIRA